MRKIIVTTLLLLATSIYAQTYDNKYGVKPFFTPELASSFVGSMQTSVAAYANIIPTETFTNNSLYGAPYTVSWLVTYTPTQTDPVTKVPSSGATPPVSATGQIPGCGSQFNAWTATLFQNQVDAKGFYDSLSSDVKPFSYLLSPIGVLTVGTPNHNWLVVWPSNSSHFCS